MARPIEAGKAFVEFVLSSKKLDTQLQQIAGKFRKFGAIGAAATGPILAGFAAASATFISVGDQLEKMSLRTGVAVESLSELKYAASQSGTSIESVEKAIKKQATTIYEAGRGTATYVDVLSDLGLRYEDIQGLSPEKQFEKLSGAIADVADPTMRAALAQRVFGRAGTELLPLLSQGSQGIADLRQRAHDLGLTFDQEAATAAAQLGDRLDDVKTQFVAMAFQIGAAIAGPLTNFLNWASETLAWVIGFVRENPNLVAAIGAITLGIAAASAAAFTFGVILAVISAHPIIAALTAIAALVIGLATYFGFASDAAGDFSKSIDDIQASTPDISARSANVQSDLQAAVSGTAVRPVSTSTAAPIVRDSSQEVVRWTRETAEGVARLVAIAKRGGLTGGAF